MNTILSTTIRGIAPINNERNTKRKCTTIPKMATDVAPILESKGLDEQLPVVMEEHYYYNTYIFNWVKNYNEKLALLKKIMENFNNNVEIFNHLTYKDLLLAVDRITKTNFSLYNHIIIIILDNKCKSERFIKTLDGINVLLYSEILTIIQTNKTLQNKPRLFVIQKLLDWSDFDDEDDDDDEENDEEDNDDDACNATKQISKRSARLYQIPYYKDRKTLYQGLTVAIKAKEFTDNFEKSPFIDTFCKIFLKNAQTVTIDKIYGMILGDIKKIQSYKNIDIEFETNQTRKDSLIFGTALATDVLRDFF